MRATSAVVVAVLCAASGALADPAPSANGPVTVQQPPVPPDLAPFSPDFQAAMANSQLEAYRYNQLTEQALALKKLCDTGFGPADICPRASRDGAASGGDGSSDSLPEIVQIGGGRGTLSAILRLSDGRHVTVRPGSQLPGGVAVAAISGDGVTLKTVAGRMALLPFVGSGIDR